MTKRSKIKKSYVQRDKKGRFTKWTGIGKSLQADRRKKAKKKVKSGHGHKGDQKWKWKSQKYISDHSQVS